MKSALIIGGDSAIGKALEAHLKAHGIPVHSTSRRADAHLRLDLSEPPELWHTLPHADVAYLCAGQTKLDACERDPQATALINVTHMQALSERLLAQGSYVVFLSTNQVFDGSAAHRKAEEKPCPRNEYGRQKAAMETWLMAQPQQASVLRLTKVITASLPVLQTWKHALLENKPIEAFSDMVMAPLALPSVLEALMLIGQRKLRGIFQLSGAEDISYLDAARALAQQLGKRKANIISRKAAEAGIPATLLPAHTTLATSDIFTMLVLDKPMNILNI